MKKARKITSTESRKGNAAQTLDHPGHSIWGMLGIAVRLGVIGALVFGATYLTSTDCGFNMAPSKYVRFEPVDFPDSEIYHFEPLDEDIPVYQEAFTLLQEAVVDASAGDHCRCL